jgi:hypothetical protein
VAFPPNYRQERSNRDRSKQRKAEEKLARRAEKSAARRDAPEDVAPMQPPPDDSKDN